MTNERDLLVDIAATARRLYPETWEHGTLPSPPRTHADLEVWLALGAKLKRLEDLRAMVRAVEGL